MISIIRCFPVWILLIVYYGCTESQVQQEKKTTVTSDSISYTVAPAPEWTSLFNKESGWFGADGIFAIPVNGNEAPGSADDSDSFLFFSDTMVGKAIEDSVFDHSTMVNNSVAIVYGDEPDADNIEFFGLKKKMVNQNHSLLPKHQIRRRESIYG